MTLEEIENSLPNGLHDAEVRALLVDYERHNVTLQVSVWIGNMDDPPERREAYKEAKLEIREFSFVIMEPPDGEYPYARPGTLCVDGCDLRKNIPAKLLRSLPENHFFRSLWVNEWNAFVHIAARDASIEWVNNEAVTYR